MPSQQVSPFKLLWQSRYPFDYWSNRLEKINPHNDQDRLEALYSLAQLTDIYSHVFAAYARNPEHPWFFIKENTFRGDIDEVLDKLRTEGRVTVGTLSEKPDGLATFEAVDGFEIDEMDAIAGALLGCPTTINQEENKVKFHESPDLHRGVCNAILGFAENNTALLNDFKHGFRILPVTPTDIEDLIGSSMLLDEEDEEDFEMALDDLRKTLSEDEWGFCFARMYSESVHYGYEVQLDFYHVDAWSCYKFAEQTLDALYNLISPEGGLYLEDRISELPELVFEGEQTIMDHLFGFSLPLRDDPDTVLTEEEFRSASRQTSDE